MNTMIIALSVISILLCLLFIVILMDPISTTIFSLIILTIIILLYVKHSLNKRVKELIEDIERNKKNNLTTNKSLQYGMMTDKNFYEKQINELKEEINKLKSNDIVKAKDEVNDSNDLNNIDKIPTTKIQTKQYTLTTYIAGTKYEGRQKIIADYLKYSCDINHFDRDDPEYIKNSDIEEESNYIPDVHYYQYEMEEYDTVSLIPEPDNPYDPKAIKVVHNDMGVLGYIPRDDQNKIKDFLNNNEKITFLLKLKGGPYKYFDEDTYKVKRSKSNFNFDLTLMPSTN